MCHSYGKLSNQLHRARTPSKGKHARTRLIVLKFVVAANTVNKFGVSMVPDANELQTRHQKTSSTLCAKVYLWFCCLIKARAEGLGDSNSI